MENDIEFWKDIEDYEGLYQVSSLGRVKSLSRINLLGHLKKERILKLSANANGYLTVVLYKDKTRKFFDVHILVANHFLDKNLKFSNSIVDHKDNDKFNNTFGNLQFISKRHNTSKDRKNKTSIYTGVSWSKSKKRWVSQIHLNGKTLHLGAFKSEHEAHLKYQNKLQNE